MTALTTEQLECLLNCIVANTGHVLGAFPANCVPLRVVQHALEFNLEIVPLRDSHFDANYHYCFVLNTHPSGSPGEHWLAFFFNANTHELEYFDSFGFQLAMYPDVNAALEVCNLLVSCVRANPVGMLQSTTSTVCGHYCVAFLYWRALHMNSPVAHFALCIMNSYSTATAEQRDALIVMPDLI